MRLENNRGYGLTANALTIFRAASGPFIADWLRRTPPQERTWANGAIVTGIALTDNADGKLGRISGPSRLGSWMDNLSDKVAITPGLRAQADRGEISPIHWKLKIIRDIAVTAVRAYADHRGRDVGAQKFGKIKTNVEFAQIIAASSPLAKRRGVLEILATSASALSVASGASLIRNLLTTDRDDHD